MAPYPITTVILAGGRGVRIGGDKGLQPLQGRPLISWVLDSVKPHSVSVLLNVNGEAAPYARFGCEVIADRLPDWQGPLAGVHAAMLHARTGWVLSVPCDTPFLPHDLIPRLFGALGGSDGDAAVAVAGGFRQPAIALYRRSVLPQLQRFLENGGRKVNDWLATLRLCEVIFPDEDNFNNINTLQDLQQAARDAAG